MVGILVPPGDGGNEAEVYEGDRGGNISWYRVQGEGSLETKGMKDMAEGERATGTPNTIYDLSSVLFHALQGGASYDTYIQDAEREGDQELADFFRQVRDEDSNRANRAQQLLAERTPTTARGPESTATSTAEGAATGVSSRTEPSSPPPGVAEDLPPTRAGEATTTEGSSPRTEPISAPPREGGVPPRRTEGATSPRSELSGDLPGAEPMTEEAPSRAVERETATTGTAEEDINPSSDILPAVPSTGEGPSGAEGAPPPRPEPSGEFPGTEPIREDASTARTEVPPPPEEVPPERAGEIPTAEEVPPPRTEDVPMAEEVPSGIPPQAPSGDVEPPVPGNIPHEDMVPPTPPPPRGAPGDVQRGASPDHPPPGTGEAPPTEQERTEREREEDRSLIDRAIDKLTGEEEPRREGPDRRT